MQNTATKISLYGLYHKEVFAKSIEVNVWKSIKNLQLQSTVVERGDTQNMFELCTFSNSFGWVMNIKRQLFC